MKLVDLDEPTTFLDHVNLGCTQRECAKRTKSLLINTETCSNHEFLLPRPKIIRMEETSHKKNVAWSYDIEGHAQKCVQLQEGGVGNCRRIFRCMFSNRETVGELSEVCSQMVLKCLYLARIGRLDIFWFVNKLVTRWARARLISTCITRTTIDDIVMWVAQHCRLGSSKTQTLLETWKIKIYLRKNLLYLWKLNICSHKLDVQEANISVSQFHRIGDYFFGCWFANGRCSCS